MSHTKGNTVNHCWTNVIPEEIPEFARTEFDEHHALLHQRQKHAFLRGSCPHLLRAVGGLVRYTDRAPLDIIERAVTAEEQYELLKQFYVWRGVISRPAMKGSMSNEELIKAFNLRAEGKGHREIAKILKRSSATIWRAFRPKDKAIRKCHMLTKRTKECLINMYKSGSNSKEIAAKTGIPKRSVEEAIYSQKEFRLGWRG